MSRAQRGSTDWHGALHASSNVSRTAGHEWAMRPCGHPGCFLWEVLLYACMFSFLLLEFDQIDRG